MANFIERDQRCVFVGNLEPRVTEEIMWELFLQAGPLEAVHIPRDKETGISRRFGFVSFTHEVSVPYAVSLLNGISLYGRAINVKPAGQGTNSPGNQSPSNSGYAFDESQLRRPLYDNTPPGQFSPQVSPHTRLLIPSPLMRGDYRQNYSSPRSPWDNVSPWQVNGERFLPRQPSPQFERYSQSGPHHRQMSYRDYRPFLP